LDEAIEAATKHANAELSLNESTKLASDSPSTAYKRNQVNNMFHVGVYFELIEFVLIFCVLLMF